MWLTRGRKKVFYLSQRVDGKPRCVYVGTGPGGVARRAARAAQAGPKSHRRSVRRLEGTDASRGGPLDELCAGLDQVVTASLLALGYHRHDRSNWRKRREHREVQDE
jgi:hypothetical protein